MAQRLVSRISLVTTLALLAACGGGGGGEASPPGGGSVSAGSLALSEANAKPGVAHALSTVQNAGASDGPLNLVTGVQVLSADGPGLARTTQLALDAWRGRFAPPKTERALPAGVTLSDQRTSCPGGGSVVVNGTLANAGGPAPGDQLSFDLQACRDTVGGAAVVMNGRFSLRFVSGNLDQLPARGVLEVSMTELSVQEGGVTTVANGDQRVELAVNSETSVRAMATGSRLGMRVTQGGATRSTTLQNYSQSTAIEGTRLTLSLSAALQTDSPRLGSGTSSYALSTPQALVMDARTGDISAGVLQLEGANHSRVLATFGAGGAATLQIDANGDGVVEKTLNSSQSELLSAL